MMTGDNYTYGDLFVMYKNVKLPCYISETNIINQFYFNKKYVNKKKKSLTVGNNMSKKG